MKTHSQNREDLHILNYFGDYKGTLVSIGENDGVTFSNAKLLIERGWLAHLLEPGSVFGLLAAEYVNNPRVTCYNYGIGERDEVVKFYESGAHIKNGTDKGLVSSCDYEETLRWRAAGVEFEETEIRLVTWATFSGVRNRFDFISLDAEGLDWMILQQIDLDAVGCRCLCIEWNGDKNLKDKYVEYCKGFKILLINRENIVFVR
jgi:hypothetical protein